MANIKHFEKSSKNVISTVPIRRDIQLEVIYIFDDSQTADGNCRAVRKQYCKCFVFPHETESLRKLTFPTAGCCNKLHRDCSSKFIGET